MAQETTRLLIFSHTVNTFLSIQFRVATCVEVYNYCVMFVFEHFLLSLCIMCDHQWQTKPKVSSVPKPHSIEPLASGGSLSMSHSSEQTPAGSEEGGGGGRASRATGVSHVCVQYNRLYTYVWHT